MQEKSKTRAESTRKGSKRDSFWRALLRFTVVLGACVQSVRRDMHYTHLPHPSFVWCSDLVRIYFPIIFVPYRDLKCFYHTYFPFRRQWFCLLQHNVWEILCDNAIYPNFGGFVATKTIGPSDPSISHVDVWRMKRCLRYEENETTCNVHFTIKISIRREKTLIS